MTYYTLGSIGREWLEGEGKAPYKYKRLFTSVTELLKKHNEPQSLDKIAHTAHIPDTEASEGLRYLTREGYITKATVTSPKQVAPTTPRPDEGPRIRTPSIEKLVESEARHKLSQERYLHSTKGQDALRKYWGDKGKVVRERYWKGNKGKLAQKVWRLKRRVSELEAYGKADELLEDARKRLKEAMEARENEDNSR